MLLISFIATLGIIILIGGGIVAYKHRKELFSVE